MDAYGVVQFGNGYLSILGLILIVIIELIFISVTYGYSRGYSKENRLPVFLLMFCSISTLFIFMLTYMGWWIYAT